MEENIKFVILLAFLLLWVVGIFKIITSDNINLIKIALACAAFIFPPFSLIYLFRRKIINTFKNEARKAPGRVVKTAEIGTKATVKITEFLLKK